MEDFKIKNFKALFHERKSRYVTLDGGFNANKTEAHMVEQVECKPQQAVAKKPNEAKADCVDKHAVVKRESYKRSVFKTKSQLAHFPIPYGVYIEDVYGSIHSVEKWDKENSDVANSVLVYMHDAMLNGSFKFRLALNAERKDVDEGRQYCEGFVFPDKETHGRMPDAEEMDWLILYEAQIKGALDACGGDMFHRNDNNAVLLFDNVKSMHYSNVISGEIVIDSKKDNDKYMFRPFADVELKTPTEKKGNAVKKESDAVKKKGNAVKKETAAVKNGVYIQDVNGKLWKTEDWDDSVKPNAIAVITPKHKFRIALAQISFPIAMNNNYDDPWENTLAGATNLTTAEADYNGASNTEQILTLQPSTRYAAGWCNSYAFPDGVTKGYLPALGELYLAYQNKAAVDAALAKCGGTAFSKDNFYWSSTFYGVDSNYRFCWLLYWYDGDVDYNYLDYNYCVRAFAPFEF